MLAVGRLFMDSNVTLKPRTLKDLTGMNGLHDNLTNDS